jgi:hypothetical protein
VYRIFAHSQRPVQRTEALPLPASAAADLVAERYLLSEDAKLGRADTECLEVDPTLAE